MYWFLVLGEVVVNYLFNKNFEGVLVELGGEIFDTLDYCLLRLTLILLTVSPKFESGEFEFFELIIYTPFDVPSSAKSCSVKKF